MSDEEEQLTGSALEFHQARVTEGYRPHHNAIDEEAIQEIECEKCGRALKYRGYIKGSSYRALGYCVCGYSDEF